MKHNNVLKGVLYLIRLSILDQSPIPNGHTHTEAIRNTVKLVRHAEQLGYHRFWVSEHHDSNRLAGSSPEVLMAHLAAITSNIRIGSGGVLLPHYSPYKVAEWFRTLEVLYPGRVDLGLGRAPGGIPIATRALQEHKHKTVDMYPELISDLIGYLHDSHGPDHRFAGLTANPVADTSPEMWLLGSSEGSAEIAAEQGTSFVFAQFINGDGGVEAVKRYRKNFRPSAVQTAPNSAVAIHLICARTEEEANTIASSLDLSLLFMSLGVRFPGIPSIEQAQHYNYTPYDLEIIRSNRRRMVVGSPDQVKRKLLELSEAYESEEFIVITITHQLEHKLTSYELLAEQFNIVTN